MTRSGAAVVVLAGGVGSRMGADSNKVYLTIGGREILSYTLDTLNRSNLVDIVVLVTRADDRDHAADLLDATVDRHPTRVTLGGATRQESERAGIEALASDIERGEVGLVAVHDGARPFLTLGLLERVLSEAAASGGAIPGTPVADTLFSLRHGTIVDAAGYAWAQTPQAFDAVTLLDAHRRAAAEAFEATDTAQVIEYFSDQVTAVVAAEPTNIKVTYRDDLGLAESYAAQWVGGGFAQPLSQRPSQPVSRSESQEMSKRS